MPLDHVDGGGPESSYFLTLPEPVCCAACASGGPLACIEAFAAPPLLPLASGAIHRPPELPDPRQPRCLVPAFDGAG